VHFVLAVVGKPRDASFANSIGEYERRAARYWPLRTVEVREEPARHASEALVRERESTRLMEAVPPGAQLVACDVGGRAMSSRDFAAWMQQQREAARDVGFVIGGAYGLADTVRDRAAMRLSLAPWTLPHELARLVLAEQLYRAGTIIRGEPYHK
jgi:23S rRNA (pseudouridine1915-N3)-methyltransferase